MPKNWIITRGGLLPGGVGNKVGDPINLDFITKVLWGGDSYSGGGTAPTAAKQRLVTFYHGIAGGGTSSGSTTAYLFKSPNQALAAKNQVVQLILSLGIATDMRASAATLVACDTPTAIAATANQKVKLTGTGMSSAGRIKFADNSTGDNSVEMTGSASDDGTTYTFVIDATIGAGTYDIEYTDAGGNCAVLEKAIVLS